VITIHFVSSDSGDWKGMYIDGELVIQGRNIKAVDALRELAEVLESFCPLRITEEEKDEAWFEEHGGYCPPELEEACSTPFDVESAAG